MGNPMRYSHGKMGLPNDGIMRIPQPAQVTPDAGRLSNAQVQNLASRNLRPSSEMLPMGQQGTPETEVIDKWFEDLQNYEATLEEMAAASLDQNFKEELSAIEQWFRVLSEAERTAALYSLLQESTQVQIRFFITVLQQMARNDPVGAFLSPNTANSSVGEQLEAKMASLGIKTPTSVAASPSTRGFQRQSTGFLSPNSASLYGSSPDVSAALAAQRSKMKNNRTSAPGTLPMDSMSYTGGNLDHVQEKPSGQQRERPRSTEHSTLGRSPRGGPIDDALSPMGVGGGSWASMVNTPIMSMLDENQAQTGDTSAKLDASAAQLSQHDGDTSRARRSSANQSNVQGVLSSMYDQGSQSWQNQAGGLPNSPPNVGSPQFNNFSVPNMSPNTLAGLQSPSGGMSNPANLQMMNTMAAIGGLNNMNSSQLLALQQQILQQQQNLSGFQQSARMGRGGSRAGVPPVLNNPTQTPSRSTGSNTLPRHPVGSPVTATPQGEEEVADITVLNDVPAWLRHLRLHKYTPNFEGSNWREMVQMNEQALIDKGVAALGARRKMLKTFEAVRQKYNIPAPAGTETSLGSRSDASEAESEHDS